MIDPLRADPDPSALLADVVSKLNEVIEAVNAIQHYLNRASPIQPPFPPVHEDTPIAY